MGIRSQDYKRKLERFIYLLEGNFGNSSLFSILSELTKHTPQIHAILWNASP